MSTPGTDTRIHDLLAVPAEQYDLAWLQESLQVAVELTGYAPALPLRLLVVPGLGLSRRPAHPQRHHAGDVPHGPGGQHPDVHRRDAVYQHEGARLPAHLTAGSCPT